MKTVYKLLLVGSKSRTDIINKAKKLHLSSVHSASAGITSFNFDINKEKILLQIWEASGSEKFKSMLPSYCKDCQGVAFVFDLNSRASYDEITPLIPIAQSKSPSDTCFFLIGVKCDKESDKQITDKEVSGLIKQYHLKSAKFSPKDESSSILFSIARIIHTHKNSTGHPTQTPPTPKSDNIQKESPRQPAEPAKIPTPQESEIPPPTDQSPQALSRQLLIAQKHEKFYKEKATELEQKIKELTEKLEESHNTEKQLTEKVNYLTKKLHTVTIQKIHQEQEKNGGIPSILQNNEIPILTVTDIDSMKQVDDPQKVKNSTITKVTKEQFLLLRTFDKNKPETEGQIDSEKVEDGQTNAEKTEGDQTSTEKVEGDQTSTEKVEDDQIVKQFFKKIQDLSLINHPNIVKVLGFCYGDETRGPSVLSEFYDVNLEQKIGSMTSNEKSLSLFAICSALKATNSKGICHGKLNPTTVFVDSSNHVKIADFTSSFLNDDEIDESGNSFKFCAPEMFHKERKLDEKVDVFAFGSILFFVLTGGQMPDFLIEDLKEEKKVPEIPSSVNEFARDLILKCWAFNPNERPSFAEIVEKIENKNFMLADDVDPSKFNF